MKTLAETLLNYYQEHEDDFNRDIEELDCCNGILGDSLEEAERWLKTEEYDFRTRSLVSKTYAKRYL